MGWRYGSYYTYLTSIDITNARLRGVEVEVLSGYVFDEIIYPFNDFIAKCRELRILNKKQPTEDVAKLMQNSVYGKFAMSTDGVRITISNEIQDEPRHLHRGRLDHYRHAEPEERSTSYMLPHWSAFITAGARLNLHNFIDHIGIDNFLYADTDSVVMTRGGYEKIDSTKYLHSPEATALLVDQYGESAKSFTEYGKWDMENQYLAFRCLAPKVYAGITHDLKIKGRAKGIPKRCTSSKLFIDFIKNESSSESFFYDSVTSFASILKGNPLVVNRNRRLSSVETSSNWIKKDGVVIAKNYGE